MDPQAIYDDIVELAKQRISYDTDYEKWAELQELFHNLYIWLKNGGFSPVVNLVDDAELTGIYGRGCGHGPDYRIFSLGCGQHEFIVYSVTGRRTFSKIL